MANCSISRLNQLLLREKCVLSSVGWLLVAQLDQRRLWVIAVPGNKRQFLHQYAQSSMTHHLNRVSNYLPLRIHTPQEKTRKLMRMHAHPHTHKRVKHHHLETIYWTFATRYQLNTELSILCLHPNSRDRLHFITLRGGNVTGLGKAHAVLEVILAFGLRIICEKNESASKNVRWRSPSSPGAQKRKPVRRSEKRHPTEREPSCVFMSGGRKKS